VVKALETIHFLRVKQRELKSILKSSLFILVTAESACISRIKLKRLPLTSGYMKRVAKQLNRNTGFILITLAILGVALGASSEKIFTASSGNVFAQQNMTNMTNMTSPTQQTTDGSSGMGGMAGGGSGAGGMMMQHGGDDSEGMSGMGGMMEHGGQGQGMSGRGGMMEHGGQGQGMSGRGGMMEHGGQGQGMSGMGGMMTMGGSGMEHKPGMMSEMCSISERMPPHYCEPSYHVMSSVKGIRINDVFPINDKQLGLEIQNINRETNTTNQDIVVVGGGGGLLAGASVIQGGWNNTTEGYLNLDGNGSIYDLNSVHIHLFPLTE